jgi:transcriptional regulator with XRE-family HTH domain
MKKNERTSGQTSMPGEHLAEFKKIGLIIRELRFNYGLLTQKELSVRCGVHFNTIRVIEHGGRNYNLVSLMKIISYFEYDLPTFVRELM